LCAPQHSVSQIVSALVVQSSTNPPPGPQHGSRNNMSCTHPRHCPCIFSHGRNLPIAGSTGATAVRRKNLCAISPASDLNGFPCLIVQFQPDQSPSRACAQRGTLTRRFEPPPPPRGLMKDVYEQCSVRFVSIFGPMALPKVPGHAEDEISRQHAPVNRHKRRCLSSVIVPSPRLRKSPPKTPASAKGWWPQNHLTTENWPARDPSYSWELNSGPPVSRVHS